MQESEFSFCDTELFNCAVLLVHKNSISYMNKKQTLNYHIEYYCEMAKTDEVLRNVLSKYDITYLLEHPSEVFNTVNVDLVKEGSFMLLNFAPQVTFPTVQFACWLPEEPSSFQKKCLEKLSTTSIELMDIGVYEKSADNQIFSIIKEEDYSQNNAYLFSRYLDEYVNGRKR